MTRLSVRISDDLREWLERKGRPVSQQLRIDLALLRELLGIIHRGDRLDRDVLDALSRVLDATETTAPALR